MNRGGIDDNSSQQFGSRRQLVFTAQLFKVAETMHHIDELFLWTDRLFLQHFDVQVAQMWGFQALVTGKLTIKLRAMDWQDASIPQGVLVNDQVAALAGNMLSKQHSFMLLGVNNLFSFHQAGLLTRYGLNYCFCDFLRSNLLLPPMPNATSEETSTPCAVAALLYFKRFPAQDELSAINLILGQSLSVAGSRGLLLSSGTTSGSLPALPGGSAQRKTQPHLSELIPRRLEDADAMRSSNPFASSAVISDKSARRLFAAIDGRKNVGEISTNIGMDLKEVYLALQFLLEHHRIQLYEPGGQAVDHSQFIDRT